MIDWQQSMQQTFEYYEVDPGTWKDRKKLDKVVSSSIDRDLEKTTLGSASFNMTEVIDESYVRTYLIAVQNGITERVPLGTHLASSSSDKFDGKKHEISYDGYTPLIELVDTKPPLGYSISSGENTMNIAGKLTAENTRAPVVTGVSEHKLYSDFISDTSDTWLTFLTDLISNAEYSFDIDEKGRILFAPVQDIASLRPVWTYTDDNSSILYADVTVERDLYSIPNVVEVYYSNSSGYYHATAVNDDPNSPTSTVSRGRKIVHRAINPDLIGMATQKQIEEYAGRLLRNLSAVEYRITYKHGYCPARVGDCVRLDYSRSDLRGVKAKVISQTIECKVGCVVTETAVYTKRLWGE